MTRAQSHWATEVELWEYLRKRLRGTWTRLEVSYPAGLCDSVGLWQGQTIWLEHKVGRPQLAAFEPAQIEFANNCFRHHVPWWCCFGYQDRVLFFPTLDFQWPAPEPEFWVSPNEVRRAVQKSRLRQTAPSAR